MDNIVYDHILIRYGELSTKGKNRKEFITCLTNNMKYALKEFTGLVFVKTYERIFIQLNGEPVAPICEKLEKVFGISSFSLCIKIPTDIEKIKETSLYIAKQKGLQTFKVIAKRTDKQFPMNSDQINREVATHILKNTDYKVDVRNPELRVQIELKQHDTYIIESIIKGAHGYPVGTAGKGLLMMSGGIDSPVAGYLTMKRGIKIECIHFASPPYTSAQATQKVIDLVKQISVYQGSIKLYIVPFTQLQLAIYEHANESYAITLMRRMMYRIANQVGKNAKALMLTNGESVGQVASQTLQSMSVIEEVSDLLVARPLFSFDKLEIIDVAKKINTYDISIQPFEDCCTIFTPKNPVTKPKLSECQYFENKFDYQPLIDQCIENVEVMYIDASKDAEEETIF
ncbi:MAG: tRNA uracil 4-sulfurtransferase ThiI [Erysipelotrichaceae bacterium]